MFTKIVNDLLGTLKWQVALVLCDDNTSITSDSVNKTHTISINAGDIRQAEIIHELCHAWLCENVHYLFSTLFFDSASEHLIPDFKDFLLAAQDWFVDDLVMKRAPALFEEHLKEHINIIRLTRRSAFKSPLIALGAALCLAQSKLYGIKVVKKETFPLFRPYSNITWSDS